MLGVFGPFTLLYDTGGGVVNKTTPLALTWPRDLYVLGDKAPLFFKEEQLLQLHFPLGRTGKRLTQRGLAGKTRRSS